MTAGVDGSERFGPYLVYERLGIGGMATVHRALERGIEGFERIVALKRLLPHLADDASFIKAFVHEAKLASALNHVNIVQIFELGRVDAEYFISMEYIEGLDVRRILRHARKVTGPPPIDVVVGILLQLCDALDYAHTKRDESGQPMKLVHRDVSPSNVLVTSAGCVKVIDFGIARAQSSTVRTKTGHVKGKLAYMAPEAVAGHEPDARCDLFAIGVIAHELLTARPLFASKNEYQTLLKVQRGDIMPPSTYNPNVGGELDAIVLRALARDPDERYPSAADLRDDLLALRQDHRLQTGPRDIATWLEWAFAPTLDAMQPVPPPEDDIGETTRLHSPAPADSLVPTRLTSIPSLASKAASSHTAVGVADIPPMLADDPDTDDLEEAERSTDMKPPARPSTSDEAPTSDRYQPVVEDAPPPPTLPAPGTSGGAIKVVRTKPLPAIGQAMLEREKPGGRSVLIIVALVALAVLATALALTFTR